MPFYKFTDECGDVIEKFMNITDYIAFKEQNPQLIRIVEAPMMMDPVRAGITKVPGGFKELLKTIDARSAGSQMKKNNII